MSETHFSEEDGAEVQRSYAEEVITPDLARTYLLANTHNRKLKQGRILAYADAIKNGRWRTNAEAIKFSKSGQLLDGQNRLHAVIKADMPAVMLVARGLEDVDQATMDIGASRSLSDILSLRGEKNTNSLAAVIRALYLWDHTEDTAKRVVGGSGQTGGQSKWLSPDELVAYYDNNTDQCRYISGKCEHYRKKTKIPPSVFAPLIREMERISYEDADDFLYRIEALLPSPKNLGESDPLVKLHNRLRNTFDNKGRTSYLQTELAALIVKSWNAYRDGTPINNLYWRCGGNAPESFPVIK